jgi:hypothetical protein
MREPVHIGGRALRKVFPNNQRSTKLTGFRFQRMVRVSRANAKVLLRICRREAEATPSAGTADWADPAGMTILLSLACLLLFAPPLFSLYQFFQRSHMLWL